MIHILLCHSPDLNGSTIEADDRALTSGVNAASRDAWLIMRDNVNVTCRY